MSYCRHCPKFLLFEYTVLAFGIMQFFVLFVPGHCSFNPLSCIHFTFMMKAPWYWRCLQHHCWLAICLLNHSLLENSMKSSSGKGYCIPYSLVEEGKRVSSEGNRTCPDELSAFITIPCSDQAMVDDDNLEVNHQRDGGVFHCFYDKDVLKLEKCGDGWGRLHSNRSSCFCSKEGTCFLPLLSTGVAWVEITYSSPSPLQCLHLGRTRVIEDNISKENPCVKTFVFVGDAISIKHSVLLTSYQPRWSAKFGAHLPYVLERLLMFTFHVSMTLALLNSLPVYFLDGEAISEVVSHYFRILSPRRRRTILQYFLFGGTVASIIMCVRIFLVLL